MEIGSCATYMSCDLFIATECKFYVDLKDFPMHSVAAVRYSVAFKIFVTLKLQKLSTTHA